MKSLLEDIGPKVTHVGDNGLALSMKIAVNLRLAVQMLAFSEGVLLAEKSGIPREIAVDVQKDLNLALEMERQLEVPLPTTAVSNEFLTAARGMGLAKQDFACILDVLARMSGVNAAGANA